MKSLSLCEHHYHSVQCKTLPTLWNNASFFYDKYINVCMYVCIYVQNVCNVYTCRMSCVQ